MKVYSVVYDEDGAYIGHGLYETHRITYSIHTTKEGAEQARKTIYNEEGRDCNIIEMELEE